MKVDEILALYGDQVIGVKIHNGDAMAIPEQVTIGNALGLTGFPTASIDRKDFGGSVFLGRSIWKTTCESQLQQRAKAEVDCFYTLDRSTRTVRIQVMANIVESMNLPLRFNAFIVEDDVTGQGSGYDQSNYLSGRAGYESNPYYSQPSTIVGYHHMKVVRKMIGGAWGVAGSLPASVKAGDFYSHEFVSRIDDGWKIDDVSFVGILQVNAPNNKQIINSVRAIEGGSLLNRIIDSDVPAAKVLTCLSDCSKPYTLENLTNNQQTYTVRLCTTDKTPADWSAGFTSGAVGLTASGTNEATGQIAVAANSTAELSLTLSTGQILGVGDAKVVLELQGTPTITRSRMISGISAEIEKVLVETGSDYSLRPYLNGPDHSDTVTLDPSDYVAFADHMTNLKLAVWNKGPSDTLSPEEIDVIKNTKNVSNFICGCYVIWGLATASDLGFFGLEYIGWNLEAFGSSNTIWISGQAGDVITGSLGEDIQGHLMGSYIDMVRITDTANVLPIMHFQNSGFRQYGNSWYFVTAQDAILGVRSTKNNSRTVLLGISPYVINDATTRRALIHNILDWLVVQESSDSLVEDFETGDFTKFPWTRSGDADWTITSGKRSSGAYSAQAGLIEDGQASTLRVTLDCSDGEISFHGRVSSESGCDYLGFYIDGVKQDEWAGEQDWAQVSFPVTAGTRTFEWTYSKDGSASSGDDTAWIDDIAFPIAAGAEPEPSADADVLVRSPNSAMPVIDGVVDAVWSLSTEQSIARLVAGIGPSGPADCSGAWRALWNWECIYVLVVVRDEALRADSGISRSWNDDSVEFYIDGNNSKGTSVDNDDHQYVFRWNTRVETPRAYHHGAPSLVGVEYAVFTTGDGYLFEIKIPWTSIMGRAPAAGQLIGIEVWINDDDNGGDRDSQISWFGTNADGWNNPSLWATGQLVGGSTLIASHPSPADGAVRTNKWASFSWSAGATAASHDVHFSENRADLEAGYAFCGNQTSTSFVVGSSGHPCPGGLASGRTCYWRVDEVEAHSSVVHRGNLWRFTARY